VASLPLDSCRAFSSLDNDWGVPFNELFLVAIEVDAVGSGVTDLFLLIGWFSVSSSGSVSSSTVLSLSSEEEISLHCTISAGLGLSSVWVGVDTRGSTQLESLFNLPATRRFGVSCRLPWKSLIKLGGLFSSLVGFTML